ncbi:hypothetical protein Ocepr_2278 (plasmid) [Oceanithermus profundus DSM 14977]|uniref:Uncharacterized protein n=1 Tax=Oceanithermus profundus (strain DSM 14977 / NBRC 100410 / VKM B-2274 / 506) TaxID=670487 RepID=E4UAU1_OCEP5|nr:hypothetical protein [Oceanithermus profundus]ADR37726.1 hypothetical protein Ocepr_2278 [Oceanithermus profundus DSM 14977]
MKNEVEQERQEFMDFVRSYVPDAVRARIRYEYEILDYGEALYPDYSLEAIEVERRDGTTVRLDRVIDERAENEPGFVDGLTDPWSEAIATEDDTLVHELLKPLVLASHDPYLKRGVLKFNLGEAA